LHRHHIASIVVPLDNCRIENAEIKPVVLKTPSFACVNCFIPFDRRVLVSTDATGASLSLQTLTAPIVEYAGELA